MKGAEVVEENEEDFEITWQLKIIKPTQLRLNREYFQVIHLANHNPSLNNTGHQNKIYFCPKNITI